MPTFKLASIKLAPINVGVQIWSFQIRSFQIRSLRVKLLFEAVKECYERITTWMWCIRIMQGAIIEANQGNNLSGTNYHANPKGEYHG